MHTWALWGIRTRQKQPNELLNVSQDTLMCHEEVNQNFSNRCEDK